MAIPLKHWWPCSFQVSSPIRELTAIQSILLLPIIIAGLLRSVGSQKKSSPKGQCIVDTRETLSLLSLISNSVTTNLRVLVLSIKVPLMSVWPLTWEAQHLYSI